MKLGWAGKTEDLFTKIRYMNFLRASLVQVWTKLADDKRSYHTATRILSFSGRSAAHTRGK